MITIPSDMEKQLELISESIDKMKYIVFESEWRYVNPLIKELQFRSKEQYINILIEQKIIKEKDRYIVKQMLEAIPDLSSENIKQMVSDMELEVSQLQSELDSLEDDISSSKLPPEGHICITDKDLKDWTEGLAETIVKDLDESIVQDLNMENIIKKKSDVEESVIEEVNLDVISPSQVEIISKKNSSVEEVDLDMLQGQLSILKTKTAKDGSNPDKMANECSKLQGTCGININRIPIPPSKIQTGPSREEAGFSSNNIVVDTISPEQTPNHITPSTDTPSTDIISAEQTLSMSITANDITSTEQTSSIDTPTINATVDHISSITNKKINIAERNNITGNIRLINEPELKLINRQPTMTLTDTNTNLRLPIKDKKFVDFLINPAFAEHKIQNFIDNWSPSCQLSNGIKETVSKLNQFPELLLAIAVNIDTQFRSQDNKFGIYVDEKDIPFMWKWGWKSTENKPLNVLLGDTLLNCIKKMCSDTYVTNFFNCVIEKIKEINPETLEGATDPKHLITIFENIANYNVEFKMFLRIMVMEFSFGKWNGLHYFKDTYKQVISAAINEMNTIHVTLAMLE